MLLRDADRKDAGQIYDLLAAEGHWQSIERIQNGIGSFTLLLSDDNLVAVLFTGYRSARAEPMVAVHPGYPACIIAESFKGLLQGIAQRQASLNSQLAYRMTEDKKADSYPQNCRQTGDMRIV